MLAMSASDNDEAIARIVNMARRSFEYVVIDPDECMDCTLCVAECPVEAI